MCPNVTTEPTSPPAATTRRSEWEKLAVALLGLAVWISFRTERRILHDTRTVTVITNVKTEAERAQARRHRDVRDDIAEIYGVAVGSPLDVVPPTSRSRASWIAPVEDPNRRLLPLRHLDRFKRPLSVRLTGHGTALGVAATGLAALAIGRRRRLRSQRRAALAVAAPDVRPSRSD